MLRQILIVALLGSSITVLASASTDKSTAKTEDIKIKEVRFVGNKKVSDVDLRENLVNKTATLGILGGKLNKKALATDALIVRDVYYQHGYLDATISRPKVTIDKNTGKAIITYTVREGAPYKVSSVRIATRNGINKKALAKNIHLRAGKIFNVETLRQDLRSITKDIGSQGYAFAKVQPRFRKSNSKKTITVVYAVSPGSRATINNIRIKGNSKTKESVIRSYLTLAPGDRYNLNDLIEAQDELGRTGLFESATIRPVPAKGGKVDLEVSIKETKTGSIMGAAGYDSLEGMFVEGSFSEKNLMGTGITLGISGSYSKLKKNGTLYFEDPRVAGTLFGLYGGVFLTNTDDNADHTYGFDKREYGGYLGIKRQITSELSGSIDYNYNDVIYTKIYDGNAYRDYIKSSIGLSLTYNNTDNFYTPRRGVYAKGRVEYAGLGSGPTFAKYIKSSLKFAGYYGLQDQIGYDLILRYKMQANHIKDLGFVPEAERLHIGGYYNGVRGYRNASIHPAGGGGLMSMVNSIEASIPLSAKNQVRLTAFADYGMIGNKSLNEVSRKSVGAQVEWRSPFGDVNFILAKAIGAKPGDKKSSFEFTIGKEF